MKWLKSTTQQSYTFEGVVIPTFRDSPIQVTDSVYEKMQKNKVIAGLLKTGGIIVLDRYAQNESSKDTAKLQSLTVENAKLADRIRELEANQASKAVTEKAAQFDALKTEAEQSLAAKDKEIAELKKQLEAASKKASKKSEE